MSEFGLGFYAGVAFCVGVSALFGRLFFVAAEAEWDDWVKHDKFPDGRAKR